MRSEPSFWRFVLIMAVLGGCSLGTAVRVSLWSGPEVWIWHEATQRSPMKVRPWVNWGNQLSANGDFEGAQIAYRQALEASSNPARGWDEQVAGRAMAEVNLGIVDVRLGKIHEGKEWFRLAFNRMPHSHVIGEVVAWANTF